MGWIKESNKIVSRKSSKPTLQSELNSLKSRMEKLENALEEKDRELREVTILRGEYIQQLNTIRNLLKKASIHPSITEIYRARGEQSTLDVIDVSEQNKDSNKKVDKNKNIFDKEDNKQTIEVLDPLESEKVDLTGEQSYRERMILMNRIDIYRLFITVIIISGEIKYPRPLTKFEERELKMFIEELNEFENMVLDLNINEGVIWDKGKTCEKQILQLFTNFFKV